MKISNASLGFLVAFFLSGSLYAENNPAAKGFDFEGSDEKAVEVADAVMVALGGERRGMARAI